MTCKRSRQLRAVLMGLQVRTLSAAGKPERMNGAVRLSLAGPSRCTLYYMVLEGQVPGRAGCAAVVLKVFLGCTVSTAGGPGWAALPVLCAVAGLGTISICEDWCREVTGAGDGPLCAVSRFPRGTR